MNALLLLVLCVAPALSARLPHIVGGTDVSSPGKYPWQASLQFFGSHSCGASLISSTWLVTAAHCVGYSSAYYSVILGLHDRTGKQMGSPTTYSLTQITKHPSYAPSTNGFPNDIAVLRLSSSARMGSYVATIPMANSNDDFVGSNCVITGWGQTCGNCGLPEILQEATVDVYSKQTCQNAWGNSIGDYHICVGKKYQSGACMGDSGGPLACQKNGMWTLAGATSWGSSSCTTSTPSVYARVSYFRSWIQQTTGV